MIYLQRGSLGEPFEVFFLEHGGIMSRKYQDFKIQPKSFPLLSLTIEKKEMVQIKAAAMPRHASYYAPSYKITRCCNCHDAALTRLSLDPPSLVNTRTPSFKLHTLSFYL